MSGVEERAGVDKEAASGRSLLPGPTLWGFATSPGVGVGRVIHATSQRTGAPLGVAREQGGVVVATDLVPADVISFTSQSLDAIVTVGGTTLSHGAILVKSLGIPAVTGLGPAVLDLPTGSLIIVDGDHGAVHVAPSRAMIEAARASRLTIPPEQEEARRLAGAPALTRDGRAIPVLSNVGSPGDSAVAIRNGADGVGMFRTEFIFLSCPDPPSEEAQYRAYRAVAEPIGDRPIIIRTLDLGADIPAWNAPPEPSPALGNRGLRFALAFPEILESQLRAIVRLARNYTVQVMFPMVTTIDELREARACLDRVLQELQPTSDTLQVGITVEVPAAALTAEVFAPLVDFFAIGTNDLTQYTLAADRSNASVAGIADGLHPGVLRLIEEVTEAGQRHARPVVVVGELASDRLAVPVLLGLGVTSLSVRANVVPDVKQMVRSIATDEAQVIAAAALRAESSARVRELVSRAISQ